MPVAIIAGIIIVGSQVFLATHGAKMLFAGALYALKQRSKGYKPNENVFTDRHVDGGMLISKSSPDKLGQCLGSLSDVVPELKEFLEKRLDITKTEAALLAKMLSAALTSYEKLGVAKTLEEQEEAVSRFREGMEPVVMYLRGFPKDRVR